MKLGEALVSIKLDTSRKEVMKIVKDMDDLGKKTQKIAKKFVEKPFTRAFQSIRKGADRTRKVFQGINAGIGIFTSTVSRLNSQLSEAQKRLESVGKTSETVNTIAKRAGFGTTAQNVKNTAVGLSGLTGMTADESLGVLNNFQKTLESASRGDFGGKSGFAIQSLVKGASKQGTLSERFLGVVEQLRGIKDISRRRQASEELLGFDAENLIQASSKTIRSALSNNFKSPAYNRASKQSGEAYLMSRYLEANRQLTVPTNVSFFSSNKMIDKLERQKLSTTDKFLADPSKIEASVEAQKVIDATSNAVGSVTAKAIGGISNAWDKVKGWFGGGDDPKEELRKQQEQQERLANMN